MGLEPTGDVTKEPNVSHPGGGAVADAPRSTPDHPVPIEARGRPQRLGPLSSLPVGASGWV